MPRHVLLDREEAAAFLNIHPQTLHRWVRSGKVPFVQKTKRGKLHFRRSDLAAMLQPKVAGDDEAA
jgi:excisionase family DNA binding protein